MCLQVETQAFGVLQPAAAIIGSNQSKPCVSEIECFVVTQVDECGPVHITVGDAGNLEGIDKTFIDQQPQPAYCSNATGLFCQQQPYSQPQCCLSYQGGNFCYDEQPAWSAYREPSFGHGTLELLNTTHARWTWNKVQWPAWKVADDVMIIRGGDKVCGDGFKQAMAALGSD